MEQRTADGRLFYWNSETNETSWALPDSGTEGEEEEEGEEDEEEEHGRLVQCVSDEDDKEEEEETKYTREVHQPRHEWVELLTRDGRPYYWNKTTRETIWERPDGLSPKERRVGSDEQRQGETSELYPKGRKTSPRAQRNREQRRAPTSDEGHDDADDDIDDETEETELPSREMRAARGRRAKALLAPGITMSRQEVEFLQRTVRPSQSASAATSTEVSPRCRRSSLSNAASSTSSVGASTEQRGTSIPQFQAGEDVSVSRCKAQATASPSVTSITSSSPSTFFHHLPSPSVTSITTSSPSTSFNSSRPARSSRRHKQRSPSEAEAAGPAADPTSLPTTPWLPNSASPRTAALNELTAQRLQPGATASTAAHAPDQSKGRRSPRGSRALLFAPLSSEDLRRLRGYSSTDLAARSQKRQASCSSCMPKSRGARAARPLASSASSTPPSTYGRTRADVVAELPIRLHELLRRHHARTLDVFRALDQTNDGLVTRDELEKALRSLGVHLSYSDMNDLFRGLLEATIEDGELALSFRGIQRALMFPREAARIIRGRYLVRNRMKMIDYKLAEIDEVRQAAEKALEKERGRRRKEVTSERERRRKEVEDERVMAASERLSAEEELEKERQRWRNEVKLEREGLEKERQRWRKEMKIERERLLKEVAKRKKEAKLANAKLAALRSYVAYNVESMQRAEERQAELEGEVTVLKQQLANALRLGSSRSPSPEAAKAQNRWRAAVEGLRRSRSRVTFSRDEPSIAEQSVTTEAAGIGLLTASPHEKASEAVGALGVVAATMDRGIDVELPSSLQPSPRSLRPGGGSR